MSESIQCETLATGLVLVAEPMPWLESAAFTILIPAGSAYDPEQLPGLSSFTCEMALRGAGDRDSRQFISDLDNLGVERGESVSAAHTSYSGATVAKNLLPALKIVSDAVLRPHLPEDQLESGRQVVLNELAAVEDEPSQKVMRELRRRLYPHPWGRPSQGEVAAIQRISIDDICGQHTRLYRPTGAIVAVAGKFDWNALRETVALIFDDWQSDDVPEPGESDAGPPLAHLPEETHQTQIAVGYPSVPYRHEDYFRAWGAVGVLSGGMSSRLFTEVREKRGLCYSVAASYHTLRHRGSVMCYSGTSNDRAQQTLDVLVGELQRLAEGIEDFELQRLKARIKSALVMQQESSSARSGAIARDWYHLGRVRTLDELGGKIDALSREEINDYLRDHPPAEFTIVTLGPQPLEVPSGVS